LVISSRRCTTLDAYLSIYLSIAAAAADVIQQLTGDGSNKLHPGQSPFFIFIFLPQYLNRRETKNTKNKSTGGVNVGQRRQTVFYRVTSAAFA
jgi:hypothetical protein